MIRAIGLICGVLAVQTSPPARTDAHARDLSRSFQLLGERREGPPKEAVVTELVSHGVEAVTYVYERFDELDHMSRYWFRTKVVPRLPPAETSAILLAEFRADAPVLKQAIPLFEQAEQTGETPAIKAAYAEIEGRYQRLRWTTDALGDLGHSDGYDAVYPVYLQYSSIRGLHSDFARALYGINPDRALRDFTSLACDPAEDKRLKGVASLRQIGKTPDCTLLARLLDDPVDQIRQEAGQCVFRLDLDCLDLLIGLSGNQDRRLRVSADMRLAMLAHLPDARVDELMAGADSPAARAEVWRKWWQRATHSSEEQRREEGLSVALKFAEHRLDAKLVSFLSGFPEYTQVYPVLRRALDDSDPSLKRAGAQAIERMAWNGQPDAVDFLLDYCAQHAIADSIGLVDTLAKTGDPRAVPVLLKMLHQDCGENYAWPRQILLALGKTGDARAVGPVVQWLSHHSDGSEQFAAMALPELAGAEAVQPQLLRKLIQQPNHNTHYALRKTIESIGGDALAAQLVRVLPEADPGGDNQEGPQKDVLLLMETFSDPAATPMLRALLKTDNRFSHLYAARVLGKLGDYSGVPVILEDLFTKHPMPHHFYGHDVGQALKDIGAPGTREQLEALYQRVEGEDRDRVLHVIGQQEDLASLPFLDGLITGSTDPQVIRGAAAAVGTIIYGLNKDKRPQALELNDANLAAARLALRWVFYDERLRDLDGRFPDHALLAKKQGAVLQAGEFPYLLYDTQSGTLREMSIQDPDDAQLIERTKTGSEDSIAHGSVHWLIHANYMSLTLGIDSGGSMYLFRSQNGNWIPVCSLGGWIE